MADNKFLLYDEQIKNNDKFNPNLEFQDNQLITRAAFEDMLDTDNYSWSGEKYQQNQFIYEYEIDNVTEISKTSISNLFESTLASTAYNKATQYYEFILGKDSDYILTEGTDFSVDGDCEITPGNSSTDYSAIIKISGTNPGDYEVIIHGEGEYDGNVTLVFEINKKSLSEATITQNNELVFSGGINDEHNPEFKIQFDNDWYFIVATNTTSNDFDVTFKSTTGHGYAGEHTNEITIKAKNDSNYTGSVQVSYFVNSAIPSISFVKNNTQVYDEYTPRYFKVNNSTVAGYLYYKIFDVETSHEIDITDESTYDDNPYIVTGDNVSISNAYRINVGTYYIIATFVPNNSSSSFSDTPSYETVTGLEGTLTIKNEGDLVIVFTSDTNNYVYNGEPKTPNFRVECNGVTINSDNYTYSYDNNTNAGTATLTVTGKNNYTGKTANATFTIKQADPNCSITSNNITYGEGTTSAFTFNINNNLSGSLTYTVYDENGTTVDNDTINVENNDDIWETDNNTDAGTYHINASFRPADENYKYVSDINDELTIDKATPTLIVNNVNTEFDFNMHYLSVEPSVDGILKFNRINSSNNNIYTQGCTANNTQQLIQIQEFNNTVETYGGSLQINLEFTPNNTNYNTITTEGSINIAPRNINQTISIWLYDDDWNEYTGATYIYDGNEKQPNIKIYISDIGNNGKTIELRSGSMTVTPATQDRGIIYRSNGVSYEVIYENNINANNNSTDPSVTVDISGNMYANPITTTFVINKATPEISFNKIDETFNFTSYDLTVTNNSSCSGNLTWGEGLSQSQSSTSTTTFINSGTTTLTHYDSYTGGSIPIWGVFTPRTQDSNNWNSVTLTNTTVNISQLEMTENNTTIILTPKTFTYDGSLKEPEVKCQYGSSSSYLYISDFTVSYSNNRNVGTAIATLTFRGNFSGTVDEQFTIEKATPSEISMENQTKYFSYTIVNDNREPATKTFTITNNNNVAGNIEYTINTTYIDINGNETNGGRQTASEQISANSSIDINIGSYVGVYNINSVKFTPSDTTNYNVYNKPGSNNLTIYSDITDIWISDTPASSFDTGTPETGNFEITQGQSLQLYVVGEESGWYNGNGVDSRYEEIDEEITTNQDITICTINNNELYGANIGASSGSSSNPNKYALHVEYENSNKDMKSHSSNVTVTSAREYLGRYAYYQDTTTQVDEITFRYTGGSSSYDIEICDVYNNNGTREYENVVDASLFDSMSCNSNGDIRVLSNGNTKTIIENTNNRTLVYIEYNESEGGNYITISRGQPVTNPSENITLDIDFEQLDHTIAINVVY